MFFFISNLHLYLFGLLVKLGLRSGGQIYITMQNFVKIRLRHIMFSMFKMAAVRNLGFSNFQTFNQTSDCDG